MAKPVIDIVPVTDDRHEEVIDYIYEQFFPREPLSIACGRKKREEEALARYQHWLKQGLSFVALDPVNDKIIGIAVNYEIHNTTYSRPPLNTLSKPHQAIVGIILQLEEGIDLFDKYQTEEAMEMCFIGVHENYTGQGLAKRLVQQSITIAKERGYKFVQSNPDNPATIHLLDKFGFKTLREARVKDFTLENGEPGFPFAHAEDVIRLCVLSL